MKLNAKKLVVALTILAAVLAYPVVSLSKSSAKSTIVLADDNTVNLSGEITAQSVAETIAKLRTLDAKASKWGGKQKPIYLYIYSPGGEIQAGLELIEAAQGMRRPVNTVTMFGASMAFQLVQALGERYILKNGTLMSHRAAGGFEGSFGGKSPSQLDSRYGFWLKRLSELDEQTVKRTNGKQTIESYKESYRDELWVTGQQSVEQGYADQLATVRCDESLNGTVSHEVSFMGLPVQYETSKCPLITAIMNIRISPPAGSQIIANLEEIKVKFLQSKNFESSVR